MHKDRTPIASDLLLVGGGHSHLFVLEAFAMRPQPGARLTLVTRDLHTPYSGMLPGLVAGHYDFDAAHIDLLPLARRAGARVIHAEISALDAERGRVEFGDRPPLEYDLVSINTGSRPVIPAGNAADHGFAVKPVDLFIADWRRIERRLCDESGDLHLAIVGGGAGSIELALAMDYRARHLPAARGRLRLSVVTDQRRLLPGHAARVGRIFTRLLKRRSIEVYYEHRVNAFTKIGLSGDFDLPIAADEVLWATHAAPPEWLQHSGLALDDNGFIAVDACLRSLSHPNLFAAGDIASVAGYPRPKSGVFAVRQGKPLARNLRLSLESRPLKPFRPQRRFLALISTGDRGAVANRGNWVLQGRWCWRLKDWIDRDFMRRFTELPDMQAGEGDEVDLEPMRCGGCGSKLGSEMLERVLRRVAKEGGVDPAAGLGHADDAALLEVPPGMQLLQSVDHFRSFVDDPWLFGRIAANHALGDLFAMGAEAHSALVIANVVHASEARQEADLFQLVSGVAETLRENDVWLAGGHSGEATEMSCGLSVNGFARREDLLLKSGMRPGDLLILTGPVGSGVIFAAEMRGKARGEWVDAALARMLTSNRRAAKVFRQAAATACTDVTGFGLAGHLFEMARASACAVELILERIPLMPGAVELAGQGIFSSLQPQNLRIRHALDDPSGCSARPAYGLIFDPQTAGGLLASVAAARADDCLDALREAGYDEAAIIGRVIERDEPAVSIRLVES